MTDQICRVVRRSDEMSHGAPDLLHEAYFEDQARGRPRRILALGVAAIVVAVAGALLLSPGGLLATSRPAAANQHDPQKLFGTWNVRDGDGHASGSLDLGGSGYFPTPADGVFNLLLPCGSLNANWHADKAGGFQIDGFGGPGCSEADLPVWLTTASGFRDSGVHELLLDANGRVVATLTNPDEGASSSSGGQG
jgi:hypothetical protein